VEDLVWRLLEVGIMESNAPANAPAEGADVVFSCERCGAPLVVDGAAAGLTLNCQRCGGPTTVPHPSAPELPEGVARPANAGAGSAATIEERLAELRRHLKENESQRTEVNGYINQLSIQLHRWQLRIQTLDERNRELMAEVVNCVTAASRSSKK